VIELNKVHQGDCLEVMKQIDDKSVDVILCDLPYGVTARNEWDVIIPFDKLWEQYNRIIKDNGTIILTAIQPFASMVVMSNLKIFKYEWIWEKTQGTGFLNAKKQPLRNHEQVLVFYKSQPKYNPQMWQSTPYTTKRLDKSYSTNYGKQVRVDTINVDGKRYPLTVQKFKYDSNKVHPTQKPVELFEYIIKTYSDEGDLVLDNCIGSGTTAVACLNLNRKFIGIELEQKYIDICNKRIMEVKSGENANDDGIPPNNKLLGILPTIL